jgi:hypothetical protein
MIKNYALEETTPEGKPTGKFYFKILNGVMGVGQIINRKILRALLAFTSKQ